MIEALKNCATKNQAETALNLGDKNRGKIKKLQTFYLSCSICKNHFDDDGSKVYFIFQQVFKYF